VRPLALFPSLAGAPGLTLATLRLPRCSVRTIYGPVYSSGSSQRCMVLYAICLSVRALVPRSSHTRHRSSPLPGTQTFTTRKRVPGCAQERCSRPRSCMPRCRAKPSNIYPEGVHMKSNWYQSSATHRCFPAYFLGNCMMPSTSSRSYHHCSSGCALP